MKRYTIKAKKVFFFIKLPDREHTMWIAFKTDMHDAFKFM